MTFYVSVVALHKRAIELQGADDELRRNEARACLLSCVIGAVGWIESFANEIFEACLSRGSHGWLAPLDAQRIIGAGAAWEAELTRSRTNPVDKHALLTKLLGNELDRKAEPVRKAALLVRLRNQLVHAEPTQFPVSNPKHRALEVELREEFTPLPGNGVFFPQMVLSVGCGAWAIRIAKAFNDHVCTHLGLAPRFDNSLPKDW